MSKRWLVLGLAVACISVSGPGPWPVAPAIAQEAATDDAPDDSIDAPDDIRHDEPGFFVHCAVNRADHTYRQGESLSIEVVCEQDAYVYVLYQQADGKVFQIFPNSVQKNNRLTAKKSLSIPAADDQFRWNVAAPYGKEVIKVIASKNEITDLNDPALREQRFNSIDKGRLSRAAAAVRQAEPVTWAEAAVEITTVAERRTEPPQGRRFGIFFGTSKYQFSKQVLASNDGKWNPDLACPANNARTLAALLKSMGELSDVRVFVDEEATKANLEEAVTRWLPSVSKPGDTVFIFNGGHGGQLPDDNGDERDGKDEWLLLHDYVDVLILDQLLKEHKAGTLDPKLEPRLAELMTVAARAGSPRDSNFLTKVDALLVRHTGVTDDLFGHWLQRLAGRQVVVILDTCHASGLAKDEKSVAAESFNFLDGEISRLKDLGQPDSVLYAACGAQESSYALRVSDAYLAGLRVDEQTKEIVRDRLNGVDLAVFSYYVVESMLSLPPPLDIEQAQKHSLARMRAYFEEINDGRRRNGLDGLIPHDSYLYNYSRRPVILKP